MTRLDTELAALAEIIGTVNVPFATKSVSDTGTLILKGIAASSALDFQGEEFDEPTLRAAFEKYMATSPTVCLEHNATLVLGRIVAAFYTPRGIEVEAEIPKPSSLAPAILTKAYEAIREGLLRSFSVGGRWKALPLANGVSKLFASYVGETSVAVQGVNPHATFELAGVKALSGSDLDRALANLGDVTTGTLDAELSALRAYSGGSTQGKILKGWSAERKAAMGVLLAAVGSTADGFPAAGDLLAYSDAAWSRAETLIDGTAMPTTAAERSALERYARVS
jgi:hypothetical protein